MKKVKPTGQVFEPEKIAKLADLTMSLEEINLYGKQIIDILNYVEQIQSVDTKNIKPTFNVSTNTNETRKDSVSKSLAQDEVLANASATKDGYIVTKGVFENE